MLIAVFTWARLLLACIGKWIRARPQAVAEFHHPIQCCFIGLVPVSTMLIALAVAPYSHTVGQALFTIGAAGQLIFGVHRTGTLWMGGRDPADTTAVAYLPTVAGSFVTAAVAGALGNTSLGALFFGAGMFSWLGLESVVLRRLLEVAPKPAALRPTMGIHFAPSVVGCVAYLSITTGTPDLFAQALLGYGVFQGLVLVRLIPWLSAQPFGPSYWAYTFTTAACGFAGLEFLERGLKGPIEWLAPAILVIANIVVVTAHSIRARRFAPGIRAVGKRFGTVQAVGVDMTFHAVWILRPTHTGGGVRVVAGRRRLQPAIALTQAEWFGQAAMIAA